MMFMCPYCKAMNGISAMFLNTIHDFDTRQIICAKCERDYYVRKMVQYVVEPIKEEIKFK